MNQSWMSRVLVARAAARRRRRPSRAAGPPDLLVVGDRRARRLVVDDEGEVGLVEAHAQRGGGDHDLDLVGEQRASISSRSSGRSSPPCRPRRRCPRRRSHDRDPRRCRRRSGSRRSPVPASVGIAPASQARRSAWRRQVERRAGPGSSRPSGPRMTTRSSPSWCSMSATTRSLAVAVHAQHRAPPAGSRSRTPADAAVVGPEVVTPVADAVGLVDHEQPGRVGHLGQDVVPEPAVVRAARARSSSTSMSPASRCGLDRRPTRRVFVAVDGGRRGRRMRSAASIWLRMSASSGETSRRRPGAVRRAAAGWR